jgi:hypothetical protein
MHLYDENGRIQQYDGSLAILKQFFRFRLGCYQKRKVRRDFPSIRLFQLCQLIPRTYAPFFLSPR